MFGYPPPTTARGWIRLFATVFATRVRSELTVATVIILALALRPKDYRSDVEWSEPPK